MAYLPTGCRKAMACFSSRAKQLITVCPLLLVVSDFSGVRFDSHWSSRGKYALDFAQKVLKTHELISDEGRRAKIRTIFTVLGGSRHYIMNIPGCVHTLNKILTWCNEEVSLLCFSSLPNHRMTTHFLRSSMDEHIHACIHSKKTHICTSVLVTLYPPTEVNHANTQVHLHILWQH